MSLYRADIDGLRALAVLAVVFFHANVAVFSGGYVGVDVFFVISGFLITSVILADIQREKFSIIHFYERRVRRLFPALFAVIFICFAFAYFIFLPHQFEKFAESSLATTIFGSNFYFWQESDYFAQPVEFVPLLHTWSLAVEEQYYIVYPVLLFLLVKYLPKNAAKLLFFGFVLSLALSIFAVSSWPNAAFYLASSRAWELLLGALLALGVIPNLQSSLARNTVAFAGLAMISWSIVTFSSATPFPGISALVPCIGTAFVMHAGARGETVVNRFLSQGPVVFVGLISYSLYLLHWPLLVFARQFFGKVELPSLIALAVVSMAFVGAALSWKFIEQPFRNRQRFSRMQIFAVGGTVMIIAMVTSILVISKKGMPHRIPPAARFLAAGENDISSLRAKCMNFSLEKARRGDFCAIGADRDIPPSFILWGDSHAGALLPGIAETASSQGHSGLFAGQIACPPLLGVARHDSDENDICEGFNEAVLAVIRTNDSLTHVILAARWAISAVGERYRHESGRKVLLEDKDSEILGAEENKAVFVRGLRRTLEALVTAGKKVIVIGPVPEIGWPVPRFLAMEKITGFRGEKSPTYDEFHERQKFVVRTIEGLSKEFDLDIVYPHDVLCDLEKCKIQKDGKSLYADDNHLSLFGSIYIRHIYEPIFD